MTLYLQLYLGEAWTHYPDVAWCRIIKHTVHTIHHRTCSHAYIHIPSRGPRCVLWQNSDRTANPQFPIWVIYTAAACQATERTPISISRDPEWENDIIPAGKPLNWPQAHKLFQIGRAWHTHSYACIHGCSCVVFNECPSSLHMNRGHVKLAWHWCSSHLCKWCKPFIRYLFVHLNDSLNTSTHFSMLWSQLRFKNIWFKNAEYVHGFLIFYRFHSNPCWKTITDVQ